MFAMNDLVEVVNPQPNEAEYLNRRGVFLRQSKPHGFAVVLIGQSVVCLHPEGLHLVEHLRDFSEWSADELASYSGPVYWARCTGVCPNGRTVAPFDHESPSLELLEAKLANQRFRGRLEVHQRGERQGR